MIFSQANGKKLLLFGIGFFLILALGPIAGARAENTPPPPAIPFISPEFAADKSGTTTTAVGPSVFPLASGGPDRFGYTWSDTQPFTWLDASSGTNAGVTGDDKFVGPIPIGFDFPFYENTYNELYITTNGLITFGEPSYSFDNRAMPFLVEPQNLIAPFWDDLHVPAATNGKIYYEGNANRLVVAWHDVARYPNTSDLLTFEAILYKDGDICYQYQDLNGTLNETTVGIEDINGTDGLTYLHKAPGLDALEGTKRVCFSRPAASRRVKMLPTNQGGLVIRGTKTYNVEVSNTGDLGKDSYEMQIQLSDPSWRMELFTTAGQPLLDADQDERYETGSIPAGGTLALQARLYAPENAGIGDHVSVDLTAISANDANAQWTIQIHGAVPTQYAQGVVIEDAISLMMIWANDIAIPLVAPSFTGSTIGVTYLPDDRYLYIWEQNDVYQDTNGNNVNFADLEFSILSGFGSAIAGPSKITSNRGDSIYTYKITDRSPVAAVTSDGKIGITWVRKITNGETRNELINIFFAVYDVNDMSAGEVNPINITQNTDWAGSGILDVPEYDDPRIALTSNGSFAITWSDSRKQTGGEESNIGLAIYTPGGQRTLFLENVPDLVSVPGSIIYSAPDIVGLADTRLMLSFVREDVFVVTNSVGYLVLDSSGNTVKDPGVIPGVQGLTPAVMQFSAGPILMTWLNPQGSQSAQQVNFATLDSVNYEIVAGPTELTTPNDLSAELISVAEDSQGYAVLTWMDMDIGQAIYYALLRQNGAVLTPPIQFFEAQGKTITVSRLNASNAPYIGKSRLYLPTIFR